MKKMKKILVAVCLVMSFALSACAKEFDASGYVKASLEANLHGKYDDYAKFRNISKEEAQKEIEEEMKDEFTLGLDELGLTDEQELAFEETFRKCFSKAKFEVGEATKEKSGDYKVPVTYQPMDCLTRFTEEFETELTANMDVLEDQNKLADFIIQFLGKMADEVTYGEKVTIDVKVKKDDKTYEIDEDDSEKVITGMLAM